MPALGPATAALSDAELRETIDLHSGVLAKMSDKIDEQGALQQQLIDVSIKGMDSILNAARAAKQQTDPARYAKYIVQSRVQAERSGRTGRKHPSAVAG